MTPLSDVYGMDRIRDAVARELLTIKAITLPVAPLQSAARRSFDFCWGWPLLQRNLSEDSLVTKLLGNVTAVITTHNVNHHGCDAAARKTGDFEDFLLFGCPRKWQYSMVEIYHWTVA